ncbi:RHS repeat-associated core domain-containing protein [bacterium]|nr:RHS repeat-associated core domain-containing protein [bacterium]
MRLTLDDAGVPIDPSGYSYTPFGIPQSGAQPEPFGFAAEQWDAATGLVYLRARWYDPASGTFLGRDPFEGFATTPYSQHPYQYAYSNPARWTDPSGRCIPYPINPLDPACQFLGWNPANWNWADGREYSYGPAGTTGKLALSLLFPPAAIIYGGENTALSYIRWREDPDECNSLLLIFDSALAVLPFVKVAKVLPGSINLSRGAGTLTFSRGETLQLSSAVHSQIVAARLIPNIYFADTGQGPQGSDPSGQGSGGGGGRDDNAQPPAPNLGPGPRQAVQDLLSKTTPGRSSPHRTYKGDATAAVNEFYKIADPNSIALHPNPTLAQQGGLQGSVPDGGRIYYRPVSTSGEPTIDLHEVPGIAARIEIKFIP